MGPHIVGTVSAIQEQQQQQIASEVALPPSRVERLNIAVQQQLNLESVKTRALGLSKAISRILDDFNAIAHTNGAPKWQGILGQFSMVNMELFNIVEDIKKVSKAFVVHPKNVNGENALIVPVMLSSKLLPEMEAEDNAMREHLLSGMINLPIPAQIEKLKARNDMIGTACETAEKVIADAWKAFGLGSRQVPNLVPTLDKVQAAKIQEQENQLRAAVNFGEGLKLTGDQRHPSSSLPSHLADVLNPGDGSHNFGESGAFSKNIPSFSSNPGNPQGSLMQAGQLIGRSVQSPSGVSIPASFDNASTPPMPYANSPRSGTNMMNTASPQQQQQRQKIMQIPQHQQQLLAQQQLRQPTSTTILGQGTMSQLHDFQGQAQHKFQQVPAQHQMQYSQPLSQQQIQNRHLQPAHLQHNLAQNQINQGNQLRSQLSQFTGSVNNALFNAAQTSPNSQMFGVSGGHHQRNLQPQILNDQMFGMAASSAANMVGIQNQQLGAQGGFGNVTGNSQSVQPSMPALQNSTQSQNFQQQRQQSQQ
ncbi:hypothetical protein HPP92_008247 [Vanilla planifolia]|uniref:Mediator of RNA polymerase II transcription subunit 8 n=1 Tax=Vanilla planifolia TaxID=51239 RepID=A0A835RI21_VANPL|nr:hypothetical protein HPP92_008247 [Vanilla planifolia]